MGKLNSLLNLILFKNKLTKLSKSLSLEKFKNLRNLVLHTNRLSSVTGFENMGSLETLDVSSNRFLDSKLPQNFASMHNLKHLYIRNTGLEKLPNNINSMPDLQLIDARDNKLETLPAKIRYLWKLRGFYISGNNICSNMNDEEIAGTYGLSNTAGKLALCTDQCAATCLNDRLGDQVCDDPSVVSFFRMLDPAFQDAFTSSIKIKANKTGHSQYGFLGDHGCNVVSCQYDQGDCL